MSQNRAPTGRNGYHEQVGYQTIDGIAQAQFVPLAVQFENIGESAEFPIANLVTVGNPAGQNQLNVGADQIWLWDTTAADWVKYFYRVQRGTIYGWCKQGETTATTDTIPAGKGFFFYRGGSATATVTFTAPEGL